MQKISLSVISFFNESELICLHICIAFFLQLNGFNYYHLTLIIRFNITHSFTPS